MTSIMFFLSSSGLWFTNRVCNSTLDGIKISSECHKAQPSEERCPGNCFEPCPPSDSISIKSNSRECASMRHSINDTLRFRFDSWRKLYITIYRNDIAAGSWASKTKDTNLSYRTSNLAAQIFRVSRRLCDGLVWPSTSQQCPRAGHAGRPDSTHKWVKNCL